MSKRQIIHAGMIEKTRVFVGRDGVTPRVLRQFRIAWEGTPVRPGRVDLVRVKVQRSCPSPLDQVVADLEADGSGIFVGARANFLIFQRRNG